ncbi:thioredoxin TrxC [Devosia nitrariae]|uniref:Thioredoxin n=1 Tax=Devosia nitrariae TaxID=2071872 RepID=A0ABQ5W0K4_9HYPH|nr:thioredoxin TrxC [Devosia nitrariae]GLQ53343.1 thiol reductase thioredoxin [Devosia nitrariae]
MNGTMHVVCTECRSVNRIAAGKPAREGRCGKCGAGLFTGHPAEVTGDGLEKQIARSDIPVVVDVWADWCGPCRMMAPQYEAAAHRLEPEFRFLKLDSEAEPGMAARFGIRGIPTMLLFHDGKEVARVSGAMQSSQISAWLREQMGQSA